MTQLISIIRHAFQNTSLIRFIVVRRNASMKNYWSLVHIYYVKATAFIVRAIVMINYGYILPRLNLRKRVKRHGNIINGESYWVDFWIKVLFRNFKNNVTELGHTSLHCRVIGHFQIKNYFPRFGDRWIKFNDQFWYI